MAKAPFGRKALAQAEFSFVHWPRSGRGLRSGPAILSGQRWLASLARAARDYLDSSKFWIVKSYQYHKFECYKIDVD